MLTNRTFGYTIDRMNRALDQALSADFTANQIWSPAVDVVEQKNAYILYAELPGVDAAHVEISFEQNVLTVRGTKPSTFDATKQGELRVYAAERVHGTFERSFKLPQFVDSDRIAADFSNGLLTITVPKAQAAQPRKISIGGAGTSAAAN